MGVFEVLSKAIRLPPGTAGAGLRDAQIAAIHAVAAHFWDSTQPALVVMPTGSGKTAVMIASAIVLSASRVLVVSPSRLLREQLVEKFEALQPLRELGALAATDPGPQVHEVKKQITTKKGWTNLSKYDVVIGVPMSMSPGLPNVAEPPPELFDLILFDEAHHRAAPSYSAIAAAFPKARQVQFTAPPFRRDQRRIPGDLIFTYELARARRDGVYGELKYCPVNAEPGDDKAIATAAASQLRADKAAGLDHRRTKCGCTNYLAAGASRMSSGPARGDRARDSAARDPAKNRDCECEGLHAGGVQSGPDEQQRSAG